MHKPERHENASFSRFYMESEVAKNTSPCRLLRVNLSSNSAAIKQLVQQQILEGVAVFTEFRVVPDVPRGIELVSEAIPMHRLSDDSCVLYRSPIAFKLAPLLQLPALDIAKQLIASIPRITQETTDQTCLDFSVEVLFPGWINFRLSDRSLATWLEQGTRQWECHQGLGAKGGLVESDSDNSVLTSVEESLVASPQPPVPTIFPIQYAHARCCSLLRLAHGQGLIKLRDWDFKTLEWQIVEPNPIPWLDERKIGNSESMILRLVHPAERRLIAQLVDVQDAIAASGQVNGVKLASTLSKAFEEFYSCCRIWGEVKTQTPKLAQARLGLVGVTQVSLRLLLQQYLDVPAPITL